MLTKIVIRNFKRFEEVEIPLGNGFVFVGPNNSGKTSVLQALALWQIGVQKTLSNQKRRYRVSINRRELVHLPVRYTDLLWHNRRIRDVRKNIPMSITLHGVDTGREWSYGVEFISAGKETLYCGPLTDNEQYSVHPATKFKIAMLPPMSGLTQVEALLQPGRIDVLVGEGQTAQILRNACYSLATQNPARWKKMREKIMQLFGVELRDPEYDEARGEIYMEYYREGAGKKQTDVLDMQSAGRGLQQTVLLLAFLYGNDAKVLVVDEPDAHLEIIRQREIYKTIRNVAEQGNRQIIAASHSEVLLNDAAQLAKAVSFVGAPYVISRPGQTLKALRDIGFEYYQTAKKHGWMLYLEGVSDWDILAAFARKIGHEVAPYLNAPPIKYLNTNLPQQARDNFNGLREAVPGLRGIVLLDRIDKTLAEGNSLIETMWRKREIENYLCSRRALVDIAASGMNTHLFGALEHEKARHIMSQEIENFEHARKTARLPAPFSGDIKASDDFLAPLFKNYAEKVGAAAVLLDKSEFYKIVEFIPQDEIDSEIKEKLDAIYEIARQAKKN